MEISEHQELGKLIVRGTDLESALRQIDQISLEKMKSSDDKAWKTINEIATKALWPV